MQNHAENQKVNWQYSGHKLTDEQIAELKAQAAIQRQDRANERKAEYDKAAEKCATYFRDRSPAHSDHPYLVAKGSVAIGGQALWGNGLPEAALGALLGFGIIKGAQIFCRWRQKKECLGSGDAFLMLSLGALLGPTLTPWGIVCATLLATLAARVLKKGKLPFGPFLVVGCLGLWIVSNLGLV